jgi:hypothetical protein
MNRTSLRLMAFCALLGVSAIAGPTSASAAWWSSNTDDSTASSDTAAASSAPAAVKTQTATQSTAPARQAQATTRTSAQAAAPVEAGSTYVRVVDGDYNASGVKIRNSEYRVAFGAATSYAKIQAGGAEISSGSSKIAADLSPNEHYSILLRKGAVNIVQDPVQDNKQKAQLILINVSSANGISLKNSPNEASDVGPAEPGTLATAPINPISIGFGIYDSANKPLASLPASPLSGGTAYAVVVYDGKDGKTAVSISKASM